MASQAGWYWQLNVVRFFSSAPGAGWTGPYPTQAAATAADNGTGGNTGGGSGDWWGSPITGQTKQSATKPSAGEWVGPYATKAEALAAAEKQGTLLPPKPLISNPLAPLADSVKYLAAGASWLSDRNNWIRIVKVVIGAGLVFMGIQQLKVVQRGESVVVNSVGKAAKVAGTAALL